MSTELALLSNDLQEQLKKIDLKSFSLSSFNKETADNLFDALRIAGLRSKLKSIIEDANVLNLLCSLQNSNIGFKTDNLSGYPKNVLKEIIIDAFMIGLMPTGNQFNIIREKLYITLEGYEALVLPNLDKNSFKFVFEEVSSTNEHSYYKLKGSYSINGTNYETPAFKVMLPNKKIVSSAIESKLRRKILKEIYRTHFVNVGINPPDIDPDDMEKIQQLNKHIPETKEYSFISGEK